MREKFSANLLKLTEETRKGAVMQIEKTLINDRLRVSKVSRKFRVPAI